MSRAQAVLWDLDGTIIDSLSIFTEIIEKVFPQLGLKALKRHEIRPEFYGSVEDVLNRLSKGYKDQDELFQLFLDNQLSQYGHPSAHEGIHDAITHFSSHGFQQAVVTSRDSYEGTPYGSRTIIKTLKLDLHIKTVICGDDTPHHKPHPEPLLMALKQLGVDPENAVMVGDQPVDAQAAQAAGCKSILIDFEKTKDSKAAHVSANPDLVCTNAHEIIEGVHKLLDINV